MLRPGGDGWSGEDWRAFFDERAGIAEFDGGLPRDQAEARAFEDLVAPAPEQWWSVFYPIWEAVGPRPRGAGAAPPLAAGSPAAVGANRPGPEPVREPRP